MPWQAARMMGSASVWWWILGIAVAVGLIWWWSSVAVRPRARVATPGEPEEKRADEEEDD